MSLLNGGNMVERNDKGQFVKGTQGISPGRPHRRTESEYLDATLKKVTLEKWGKVVDQALNDAIAGDAKARQWLGDYVLGKPTQVLDLKGGDVHLLADLLERLKARGLEAADIFAALLAVVEAEESTDEND